jgi:hypothetical protein
MISSRLGATALALAGAMRTCAPTRRAHSAPAHAHPAHARGRGCEHKRARAARRLQS